MGLLRIFLLMISGMITLSWTPKAILYATDRSLSSEKYASGYSAGVLEEVSKGILVKASKDVPEGVPIIVTEETIENTIENTIEKTEEISEEPIEEISEEPIEEVSEEPIEEISEEPIEEISEEPIEEVSEEPIEEVSEEPIEEVSEESIEEVSEEPIEEISEESIEEILEETSEKTSEETSEKTLEETSEEISKEASEEKVVRVGWDESAFHHTDQFGRRSGYGYEYEQRVAAYTDWKYEYVEASWPELLDMLIAGDLDLLGDVSYTEERAQKILYSGEAMGAEGYHIYITPTNADIRPDDYATLNGKRVGVNKNSIQEGLFVEWAQDHGVETTLIELTEDMPVVFQMLAEGELDALVALDTYGTTADVIPVWKVGSSEIYFGVNRQRPDLKKDLDLAMGRLLEDNRDYNQQLAERFNKSGALNSFLTVEEKSWFNEQLVIRVGYRDDFLPYCDQDNLTGTLMGALADFLNYAQSCEKNARLSFETKAFHTTEELLQALKNKEIDCIFPINFSTYDGEIQGILITDPFVETEMYAAFSGTNHRGISPDKEMKVAVLERHWNQDTFLRDYFPKWQIFYTQSTQESMKAVASGAADCSLVSNYRVNHIGEVYSKYKLTFLSTGQSMNLCFAVRREDKRLYSIFNKVLRQVPDTLVNSALTNYGFGDEEITFMMFLRANLINFIAIVSLITVVILLLVLWNLKTKAQVKEGREIISEAERDPLTNLYNQNFFMVYANRHYREHPEKPMDAVMVNINRFHSVNAIHNREYGDNVLRALGEEILRIGTESAGITGRFEADRFYIYGEHREDWQDEFEHLQTKMDNLFHNSSIQLRMGVKPWQEGMEPIAQIDRARIACNKMRGSFNTKVVVYDTQMDQREERDQRLLNDLGPALEKRQLEVYYQPKYYIQREPALLSSAEALVRWRHPELGMISPGEFIPLFEKSGQISAIDKYVWEEAARQIADWRERYGKTLPVSVNLSRVDIFDPDLIATLDGLVSRYGLSSKDIKLEVTESAYSESEEQLLKVISSLRAKGYEIEMDDFGSGYSSLNMVSAMPIDILKMDRTFILNVERNEKDLRLVELIMDIAQYLKVPVIAEGVETKKQLELLRNTGCNLVQGYYFSRPLPAGEFEEKILKESVL